MKKNRATASRSKKVYLRHPEEGDFDELLEMYRASRNHFRGVMHTKYARATFARMLEEAAKESNEYFVICLVCDDNIVGTINLSQIFRKAFQNAYLGYALGAGFTGNGYMTEAVELALNFAFDDLKLHRVEANVQPSNKPSIAVLQRCGFSKEGFSRRYLKIGGRWRDHERWAIIRDDWEGTK